MESHDTQLVFIPASFRWYLFRNVTGDVPGLACPSPSQYREELRLASRPLASGLCCGEVLDRRRALMVQIHAAYTYIRRQSMPVI